MGRLIHLDWLLVCVSWFDYCIFEWSERNVSFAHINGVSNIYASVSGSAVSRALTAGRQPCLRGRVTPLCCLLSLSRAQVCLYMDGAVSIYTHTSPSHTHTHTRTEGSCSEHHPLLLEHSAKFKPHSKLWGHSHWHLCCLD